MANPRSAAAKRLLKGAQQQRQAKNKKATASTMKNMKSVAKGTYANRSNAKAAEANVKSPVKATKKAPKKATTKKTNYDNMSFSKAFAAGRKVALAGGSKTFTWRGKTYGTNLKKKAPKTTPRPNVTAGLKAEQKKASNKAVKKVEQNIASSTKNKPEVKSSQVSFKSKSRLLANKPGQSSSRKPYQTKAKPAQPVAKPRAAAKPKAKPKTKKKSSGSAIGRFERGLVRGMNRGIRKAKRAVRRALK